MGDQAVSGLVRQGGHSFLVFTGIIAFDISFSASLGRPEGRCDVKEKVIVYGLE